MYGSFSYSFICNATLEIISNYHSLSFHLRSFQIQIYWRVMCPFRSSLLLLVLPSGFYCFALVERKKEEKSCDLASSMGVVFVYLFSFERIFLVDHTTVHSLLHFIVIFASNIFVSFNLKSKVKSK